MEREEVVAGIRAAFAGVTLGKGVSLRQAQAQEKYGAGLTDAEYEVLPEAEVTDNWSLVPEDELRRGCVEFLDDAGLRYYLPAFLLRMLDHYGEDLIVDSSGPDIGTIAAIAPYDQFRKSGYAVFDGWTPEQRAAIAVYAEALPRLVDLYHEEATRVDRAIGDYWGHFLPED